MGEWNLVISPRLRVSAGGAAIFIAALAVVSPKASPAASPDPLSDLKAAVAAFQAKQTASAIAALKPLASRFPKLADYVAWFLASAQFDAQNYAEIPKTLEPVFVQSPPSPLLWRAALLEAKTFQLSGNTHAAVDLLRKVYDQLPQPQGDLALANVFSADGDGVSSAVYNQRVYYAYPTSADAALADANIAKLKAQLGDQYPPSMGDAMLGRAVKLLDAGQPERARKELIALIPQLAGLDLDLARVKLGVADYVNRDTAVAQRYLSALVIESPEADAERLHFLLLCARRLNQRDAMQDALDQLARLHASSKWRLEALIAVANSYLVENQAESYEPLFRACYESFPKEPRAADCHWKVTWNHYLRRRDDAPALLREQLRMFPAAEPAPAALYFLGRLAEASSDRAAARAYYNEISSQYPNFYYASLARDRMADGDAGLAGSAASPATAEFLRTIAFSTRARVRSFEPNALAKVRIERARLLTTAGLDDWAEIELRYAAQNEDQPQVIGLELARAHQHEGPDQALRYLKRYVSDYLYVPLDSAPAEFWRLAFPLPYRADLERFAKQNNLDPFLLAALIRQESEFNPKAVSTASARGLTQIKPETGRELSRQLKLKPYSTARLFVPAVNLQLGTFYLRSIADRVNQKWEAVLAAYNAGPSRANAWLKWGDFREPAEFMETVPFSQTRDYIQIVFRNADVYRRLYASEKPAADPPTRLSYSNGVDQPKKSVRSTGAR